TIVTEKGKPLVALGSPGGSTIITTVLGLLVDFIDRGETLEDAIAAPRATQRNTVWVEAEPAWLETWSGDLEPFGHLLRETTLPGGEIGAATGIEFLRGKQLVAVAEPVRRGGGDARVVERS
ncbi:MAG: gamma-glutamyltransferase, partial [Nocardioides sp.]|nr:gamma-glutamyltransferase [Nocardioides sp.]